MHTREIQKLIKTTNILDCNGRKQLKIIRMKLGHAIHRNELEKDKFPKQPSIMLSVPQSIGKFNSGIPLPGPGTNFVHEIQNDRKISRAKLGGNSKRDQIYRQSQAPGPGHYEITSQKNIGRLRSAPMIKFGSSTRSPLIQSTMLTSPAPGAYEYKSNIIEGPQIKFKGSHYDPLQKEMKNIPGVGAYEPRLIPKHKSPLYKIGNSKRPDSTRTSIPAPGDYNIELKSDTPLYGFGKEARIPNKKNNNFPGPGTHEIKNTFGDVPEYIKSHKITINKQ